ncbi:hypothetical protein ACQRIU_004387 [Beauveria bassiana]
MTGKCPDDDGSNARRRHVWGLYFPGTSVFAVVGAGQNHCVYYALSSYTILIAQSSRSALNTHNTRHAIP